MTDVSLAPVPDRDSEHYFAALAQGRLEIQQCGDCGHWTWPPRPICSFCQSDNLVAKPAAGTGEVHSWVVAHRPALPGLVSLVPYTIALVRIDEQADILIPGRLVSDVEVRQGLRVRAVPRKLTDDVGEVLWEADETAT